MTKTQRKGLVFLIVGMVIGTNILNYAGSIPTFLGLLCYLCAMGGAYVLVESKT